jgi:rod shape-determining protein MreD
VIAAGVTFLRRVVAIPVLLALAVIAQVSLVNRLPLPGDAAPNLVLLVVTALAVASGPVPGMLAGFLGGLALDVAPPGSILTGEYALVFCLVGYLCGAVALRQRKLVAQGAPDPGLLAALPVMAAGTVAAEALLAGLGRLVSDPRMSVPAIEHVLPAAIIYDLLLSPFVLRLISAVKGAPEPGSVEAAPAVLATPKAPVTGYAVVRRAGAGALVMPSGRAAAVPSLRFAGHRPAPVRALSRPDPKLRFASGSLPSRYQTNPSLGRGRASSGTRGTVRAGAFRSGASGGTAFRNGALGGAAFRGTGGLRTGVLGGRAPRIDFSGALGPSLFAGSGPLGLGGSGLGALRPDARRLGRNWIRAGSSSTAFRKAMVGQEGIGGRLAPFRSANGSLRQGWLRASRDMAPSRSTALPPKGSPPKGWLRSSRDMAPSRSTALPPKGSPPKGWLRSSPDMAPSRSTALPQKGSPRKGWLRPAKPAPAVQQRRPGKGWLRPAKPAPAVQQRRPGKGWLRPAKPAPAVQQRRPGKGWLRPAKPVAPARRAKPGRGWLSRKPARITLQRKPPRGGWLRHKGSQYRGGGLGAPRTRIGGRR